VLRKEEEVVQKQETQQEVNQETHQEVKVV
jgi:hypothetical protein